MNTTIIKTPIQGLWDNDIEKCSISLNKIPISHIEVTDDIQQGSIDNYRKLEKLLFFEISKLFSELKTDYNKELALKNLGVYKKLNSSLNNYYTKDLTLQVLNSLYIYTWIKYADDKEGNGISDNPEGKLYIGIASNLSTITASNDPTIYKWSLLKQTPYEEAVTLGIVTSYDEWINLIRGEKGDKGDDGTVSFDELTDTLKSELVTKSIVDTQLDANSINPVSNSAMYTAISSLLENYKDLLNMNISLSNTITSMQNLMIHLGIPVLMVTDDEYETLEANGLINPEALYLTTDETSATIKDLSGSWTFGGTFPISFGTITEKEETSFVFPGTFPISFGTGEKSTNEFDLEFTITFK